MKRAIDKSLKTLEHDEQLSRRHLLQLSAGAAGAVLGASPGAGRNLRPAIGQGVTDTGDAATKRGGILKLAFETTPDDLNPFTMIAIASAWVTEQIYDTLFVFDQNLQPVPHLCTELEVPDVKSYIFHLVENATFSDGSPLTAEDVKFSLEQYKDPNVGRRAWAQPIEAIDVIDQHAVRVMLSAPFAPLIGYLAWHYSPIVSRAFYEANGGDLRQKAMGSGPFTLEEFVPDQHIRFGRNQHYWQKELPYLDGMEWLILPTEQLRVAALRAEEVQIFLTLDSAVVDSLASNPDEVMAQAYSSLGHAVTGINCTAGPLADKRVRQALSYAADRNELLQVAAQGLGQVTGYIPPPETFWAIPPSDLPTYHTNVEMAKELMQLAGYESGVDVTLRASPLYLFDLINAQVLQQQLKAINVNVQIEQMEWVNFLQAFVTSDFELINGINVGEPDPDGYTWNRFHSQSPSNYLQFGDPDLDALMDAARTTVDRKERQALYRDIQLKLDDLVPALYHYVFTAWFVHTPNVHGVAPMANASWPFLRRVWVDQ